MADPVSEQLQIAGLQIVDANSPTAKPHPLLVMSEAVIRQRNGKAAQNNCR